MKWVKRSNPKISVSPLKCQEIWERKDLYLDNFYVVPERDYKLKVSNEETS